ncbi:Slc25a16, partial [Symbiodinium sp. KB8]
MSESEAFPGHLSADRRLFFAALFAHGSARVLSKVASAPIERVKVCLQVGTTPTVASFREPFREQPGARLLQHFRDILHREGYRGLWRGAGTHVTATCLGGVARLSALRTTQMWVMPGGDRHYQGLEGYVRRCSFLFMSGAGALTLVYPLDVAYTCLAADCDSRRRFRGVFHFFREAAREHGVLSLYRGLPLGLLTAFPFLCIATGLHDLLAPWLMKRMGHRPSIDHNPPQPGDLFWLVRTGAPAHLYPWNLVVGAASGLVAQTATYPLDTLRRRWQQTCARPRCDAPASLQECARSLYAERRLAGFYAGVGLNSLKLLPEIVVLSSVYFLINASGNFLVAIPEQLRVLVSLTAPKMCAVHFAGRHFLGGRFGWILIEKSVSWSGETVSGSSSVHKASIVLVLLMPAQYATFPRYPAMRSFTATVAQRPVPPSIVEKYALRLPAYPGVQHQDEVEREEQASGERSYKQTWLLDGDIKSKFSYAAHRELMAHDNGAGEIEEYIEEMPPATEPVKRLGDIVKVEEIPRPGSSASTAFDSRPGSAVRPGSAMSWETGRPQSARRPYPPLSRPTSAVVRPSRPSSARPQSTLPAVSPSVTSEDTGTRSSQDPRPYQREEPTGDTLNDLEQEVAKINAAQPRSSPSHPRDGRPRRTSRTSVNSTLSDHYEYEGRDIAAGSPNLSEAGNEPDSRPVGPLARVLSDMEEDREGEVVEEPPAEQQAAKLGEFSIITIRRLFDELDTERKGFVTRRELLFALNSREDLYQQFCYFYLRSAEQEGPEDLDRLQAAAADLPVVDDWLRPVLSLLSRSNQVLKHAALVVAYKQVPGSTGFVLLQWFCHPLRRTSAEGDVGSSQRLYQKCYNITLEILIHYFRMQGLLLEYQTAPILNLLPEDRTVWVDQVPPVFQALQASR